MKTYQNLKKHMTPVFGPNGCSKIFCAIAPGALNGFGSKSANHDVAKRLINTNNVIIRRIESNIYIRQWSHIS